MNDYTVENKASGPDQDAIKYYKRDFWETENLKLAVPHFRMRKVARVVSRLARGRECDLLDVGCGAATLGSLMPRNVHYHGIDIAIQEAAPNLLEMDILESPIGFDDKKFDLVVGQGIFEYVGEYQSQKFAEIAAVLKDGGKFILTYQNFGHVHADIYPTYSNVQQPADFRGDLGRFFKIERSFPASHNWKHGQPIRPFMKVSQAHLNINVPIISPVLAVEYLYVCSPLR